MNSLNENAVLIDKRIGETPLEALEHFRSTCPHLKGVPMTYAGRLDPMAEGKLLILIGDECKNKGKYLEFDKEYEVEIVFGISTDTHDALGLAEVEPIEVRPIRPDFQKYVKKFRQSYPAFSSKTVNGEQLHELARKGELPEEMPEKEVEIHSIELIDEGKITALELKDRILRNISLVKGDFRQEAITKRWNEVFSGEVADFGMIKIKVGCSSGTYMRSLANRIGSDLSTGAFALSICRTRIGGL